MGIPKWANRSENHGSDTTRNPLQEIAIKVAALSTATCLMMAPALAGAALAQVPDGKLQVTGPELLSIIKEDFLKRKYLVTGNLTQGVRLHGLMDGLIANKARLRGG